MGADERAPLKKLSYWRAKSGQIALFLLFYEPMNTAQNKKREKGVGS